MINFRLHKFIIIFSLIAYQAFGNNGPSKIITNLKIECQNTILKNFNQTIITANKGLEASIKEKDSVSYAFFERILGSCYYFTGDYNKAASYYNIAIHVLERQQNLKELGLSYNELAKLYRKTKKLKLAQETYDKAITIFNELKDSANISMINNESGVVFEYKGDYKEALKRYNLSLIISKNLKDKVAIAYALNNIAGIYSLEKKYTLAGNYLIEALNIRKLLKDSFSIAVNYTDISSNTISSGSIENAIKYTDSSLFICEKLKYKELQSQNYLIKSNAYYKMNNPSFAYIFFKKYVELKDSIFTKESENQINELNAKYQTEKKDLELEKNKTEIENEKNKRYMTYGALAFFMILFSIAIWAFIQKRKNSNLLQLKNGQLENANKEISHQQEELTEKQKEIVDSINYAQKIQNALLASKSALVANLKDHFILFKPKDIVSGDFTWSTKRDNLFYLACCDSTGHGVPGAFMSLLNIGFLSEAIKERHILEPGKIFDYVRGRLIETIGNDDQKDGFDGILMCLDLNTKTITYAAANNSPLLISNNEAVYLKCDKMPVGDGIKTDSFTSFKLEYQPNDSLYLFTDGYPDQFGGPKGKKFKYKPLEDLLLQHASLNLEAQKEKLNTCFEAWKGNLEQVDDVCIIGITL